MKEKQKIKFVSVLTLSLLVIGLFFFQNENPDSSIYNFKSFQHRTQVSATMPIEKYKKKILAPDLSNNIKREIAQRRPLPSKKTGPMPLRIKRRKTEKIIRQTSEYDYSLGGITLKHNLYAIKDSEVIPDDYKVIEQKLGFLIVETNITPSNALSIVTSEGSSEYAIFTGVLKIKFKDIEFYMDILSNYNGRVVEDYSHINTILFQFDQFEETMQAYKELQNNPEIENVVVELLQYQRSAK